MSFGLRGKHFRVNLPPSGFELLPRWHTASGPGDGRTGSEESREMPVSFCSTPRGTFDVCIVIFWGRLLDSDEQFDPNVKDLKKYITFEVMLKRFCHLASELLTTTIP